MWNRERRPRTIVPKTGRILAGIALFRSRSVCYASPPPQVVGSGDERICRLQRGGYGGMDCLPHYTTASDSGDGARRDEGRASSRHTSAQAAFSGPPKGQESRPKSPCSQIPQLAVTIGAWGYAQADFEEFEALRRRIPRWAPADTPAHFFRYSDEQTILGAWAIDDAMRRAGLCAEQLRGWGIIAAPEFLGRPQLAAFIERFQKNGGPRVSPNSIVQHSLHSVSGALSILLATRGPNVGTGGGQAAFSEGLLTAVSMFEAHLADGCWLVATTWDPLPLPDAEGNCLGPARCHAVALALQKAGGRAAGALTLRDANGAEGPTPNETTAANVPRLIRAFQRFDVRASAQELTWSLPWGATLALELQRPAIGLRRAA